MRWRLAAARAWHLPVVWVGAEPEPALVQATVVHVIHHVHHYLPAGQIPQLPQQRDAITSEYRADVNP